MNVLPAMDLFDLACLTDAATLVDSKLEILDARARTSADPDGDGILDRAEYLTGFGLIACQAYITESIAMSSMGRPEALKLGPMHRCGHSIVTLINATANYWKHAPEWSDPLTRRAEITANLLTDLGVDINSSYVVVNSLYEILRPQNHRIHLVIPFLSQWRNALHRSMKRDA